jgi:hypothetical protein
MKKLSLRLDDLHVETFATAEPRSGRGTVQGHYGTTHTQAGHTCDVSCEGTCEASCNGTCLDSCNGTCGVSCNPTCGGTCYYTCPDTCGVIIP